MNADHRLAGQRQRAIFRACGVGLAFLGGGGRIQEANQALQELLGYSGEELEGRSLMDFCPPEDVPLIYDQLAELSFLGESSLDTELTLIRKDGSRFWVHLTAVAVPGRDGHAGGIALTVQDSTDYVEVHQELKESLGRARGMEGSLRDLFQAVPHALLVVNLYGQVLMGNRRAIEMFGYGEAELQQRSIRELLPGVLGEAEPFLRLDGEIGGNGSHFGQERSAKAVAKRGEGIPVLARCGPVEWEGLESSLWIIEDVSERQTMKAQLEQAIYYDALTCLPNRLQLRERLQQILKASSGHGLRVALLFLDIDRFKHLNDSLGIEVGDKVLVEVAARLGATLFSNDVVARYCGDKYVVILDQVRGTDFLAGVAQKVLAAMATPFHIAEHELFITVSIGIAVSPGDGTTAEELLRNGEAAMYRIKEDGGGYHFYAPKMNSRSLERHKLETGLYRALERGEFRLRYQPLVNPDDGMVEGAEALVRWQHPEKGEVSPEEFIPLLEENGLILPVGEWILHQACLQAKEWRRLLRPDFQMAVNISPRQFQAGDFVDRLQEIMLETGLEPQGLELEITEGVLMRDTALSARILEEMERLGLSVSIDDFGTGYSSLYYLKRFPVHTLKLDRNFVAGLPGNRDDVAISSAVCALARSLGLKVIAEGVERKEQLDLLRTWDCWRIQGYLFSRPLIAQAFERWALLSLSRQGLVQVLTEQPQACRPSPPDFE